MIGDKIKELRKINDITQQELANKLGISFQALSNYENNRRTPNVEQIKLICIFFNISADELLEIDTEKDRQKVQINNSFNKKRIFHHRNLGHIAIHSRFSYRRCKHYRQGAKRIYEYELRGTHHIQRTGSSLGFERKNVEIYGQFIGCFRNQIGQCVHVERKNHYSEI